MLFTPISGIVARKTNMELKVRVLIHIIIDHFNTNTPLIEVKFFNFDINI